MCASKQYASAGFTVIELTIATLVFSTILIVIVSGVLSFTKSYYRGVNTSATQNATRNVIDIVGQAIQFSSPRDVNPGNTGSAGPGAVATFCAGGYQFVYKLGQEYNPASLTSFGMYSYPITTTCAIPPTSPVLPPFVPAGKKQFLSKNMRVTAFSMMQSGQIYTINLRIANGDDDLITPLTGNNVHCKSQSGSQFCAVSGVQAAVQERVQ